MEGLGRCERASSCRTNGEHARVSQDDGRWVHVKETTHIGEGKMFSPGNLRATFDNPAYEKLINHYLTEKYTLRYTGGMVPDVFQIIVKEKGVFTNITSPSSKAKLRCDALPISRRCALQRPVCRPSTFFQEV